MGMKAPAAPRGFQKKMGPSQHFCKARALRAVQFHQLNIFHFVSHVPRENFA